MRPEHARLWRDGDWSGPFEGEVAYVEALGRETFLGRRRDCVLPASRAARPAQVGDTVRYGLVRDGLRFFDAETGARACDR